MGSASNARRARVERGIYLQSNGKYAVCCRHAGKLRFRTARSQDLDRARPGHRPRRTARQLQPPGRGQPGQAAGTGRPARQRGPRGPALALQLETTNATRLRLRSAPSGLRLSRNGLLRWTPSAQAGRRSAATIRVEGCTTDRRCLTRRFSVAAVPRGILPFAPTRGFTVLPNAASLSQVQAGAARIKIKAHGIDQRAVVRIDGRRVKTIRLGDATLELRLPRRLAPGPHDVSLQIGRDAEETNRRALTVYRR